MSHYKKRQPHEMKLSQMVTPTGFEPVTYGLEGRCSIQLSYGAGLESFSGRKYKKLIRT